MLFGYTEDSSGAKTYRCAAAGTQAISDWATRRGLDTTIQTTATPGDMGSGGRQLPCAACAFDFSAIAVQVNANKADIAGLHTALGKLEKIRLSKSSLLFRASGDSGTVDVIANSSGNVEAISSDPSLCTVSVSGRTVTVTAVVGGEHAAEIFVRVLGDSTYSESGNLKTNILPQFKAALPSDLQAVIKTVQKLAHPQNAYLDSWMARMRSLKNSMSRNP